MSNNKYRNLLSNTLIFAIGTFSTKLLVLFLFPLYTNLLNPTEMGTVELIVNTSNFILPIMYVSISEAIIRFGMERDVDKRSVYTTGVRVLFTGFGILCLFYPLISMLPNIAGYTKLIYIYVLASALRTITTHFVRALGHIKLFAMDGIVTTLTTIGLNLLFLVKLKMGVQGYILATIVADLFSAISLTLIAGTWRYFSLKQYDKSVGREMLAYSLPLVPTSAFWWVTNLSDRSLIAFFMDVSYTGVYSAANKLPQIITIVSSIFIQAWQLSAFTEYGTKEGERFYSNVFRSYYTLIFLAASGIFMLIKPIMGILQADYYEGWRYAPLLILGVSFSCFVTFLGTIYNAAKQNMMVTVTTGIGAIINVTSNIILIPRWGVQGAAFSTFICYFVVFVIRAIDTRKYMNLRMQPIRIALNLVLLLFQAWLLFQGYPREILFQILMFLLLVIVNLPQLLFMLRKFMGALYRRGH